MTASFFHNDQNLESAQANPSSEVLTCEACRGTGLSAFSGTVQRQCCRCWGAGKRVPDSHVPAAGWGMEALT